MEQLLDVGPLSVRVYHVFRRATLNNETEKKKTNLQ